MLFIYHLLIFLCSWQSLYQQNLSISLNIYLQPMLPGQYCPSISTPLKILYKILIFLYTEDTRILLFFVEHYTIKIFLHVLLQNPRNSIPQNSSCTAAYLSSHKQELSDTAREIRINSRVKFSYRFLHIVTHVLTNQQGLTYIH